VGKTTEVLRCPAKRFWGDGRPIEGQQIHDGGLGESFE